MRTPRVQTDNREINQLQSNFAAVLDPIASRPITQGAILKGVVLAAGTTGVSHGLGKAPQGWIVIRQRAAASIYDTQDTNSIPGLTLDLVSSAAVIVDLYVF